MPGWNDLRKLRLYSKILYRSNVRQTSEKKERKARPGLYTYKKIACKTGRHEFTTLQKEEGEEGEEQGQKVHLGEIV